MSEFEIISLLRETSAAIAQEFQFFISATFAVIVATSTAGFKLNIQSRVLVAIVYILATALFYLRYEQLAIQGAFLIQSLAALGSEFPRPDTLLQGWLRRSLFFVGSFATVILIFLPALISRREESRAGT